MIAKIKELVGLLNFITGYLTKVANQETVKEQDRYKILTDYAKIYPHELVMIKVTPNKHFIHVPLIDYEAFNNHVNRGLNCHKSLHTITFKGPYHFIFELKA